MDKELKNLIKIVLCLTGIFLFVSTCNSITGRNTRTEIRYRSVPSKNSNQGHVGRRTANGIRYPGWQKRVRGW